MGHRPLGGGRIVGQIRDALSGRIRWEMGKGSRAVATIIDSRSVKAASAVGQDTRGYDPGKKINGHKRHLVVDTRCLNLMVMVTPADLHDSQAANEVLFRLRLMRPESAIIWAGRAYAGKLVSARRQSRDYERLIQHIETLITWAAITHVQLRTLICRSWTRIRTKSVCSE